MVQNAVHLPAEFAVNLGDHAIYQRFFYRLTLVVRFQQLADKGRDAPPGDGIGLVFGVQVGFGDNAIQQAVVGLAGTTLYGGVCTHGSLRSGVVGQPQLSQDLAAGLFIIKQRFNRTAKGGGVAQRPLEGDQSFAQLH